MPHSYKVVVAKYKEDIDWLIHMDLNNVIVYDKSGDPIPGAIPRKNVGREAETYFHYILENYYNLPEYVIFLQGDPFPHIENENICAENLQENLTYLLNTYPPREKAIPFFTKWLYYPKVPLHTSWPAFHFPKYYNLLFNKEPPEVRFFSAGCQYIVPRSTIISRPITFYMKLYDMILNNTINDFYHAHNVEEPFNPDAIHGWVLERLMGYIFDLTV